MPNNQCKHGITIFQCSLCKNNAGELKKLGITPQRDSVVTPLPITATHVTTLQIPNDEDLGPEDGEETSKIPPLREEDLGPREDLDDDKGKEGTPPEDVEQNMQETPAASVPTPKPVTASPHHSNDTRPHAPVIHLTTGHEENPDLPPPMTKPVVASHFSRRGARKKKAATSSSPPVSTARKDRPKRRTRGETILKKLGMLRGRLENIFGMSPEQISPITPEERTEIVQQISVLMWHLQKLGIKFSST